MIFSLQFSLALILDLLWGDPAGLPHPVRLLGWLCNRLEGLTRRFCPSALTAGLLTVILALLGTVIFLTALLALIQQLAPWVADLLAIVILYTAVACEDLVNHSRSVYRALVTAANLPLARQRVSMIVGRDTAALDAAGVSRACVETVAENMVDGVTAPIFFAILASLLPANELLSPIALAAIGAYGYKIINTMDSMFGYKNERYLDFGRTAARLDDLANFLPARLSGLLLVPVAALLGYDGRGAWRIFRRDRLAHASPNSAHSEAAVAGALGIRLGGDSSYFGVRVSKPTIGDANRPLVAADILAANRLMVTGSLLFALVMLLGRWFLKG